MQGFSGPSGDVTSQKGDCDKKKLKNKLDF